MDRADVLSGATERQLASRLLAYERETGHQVVVHTTPSLEGLTIEDYSIQIAEAWKIGHAGLDNGVILTVAPSERQVRIEVGYGLEGALPDAVAFQIIDEQILPEFRTGRLEAGIVAGTSAILSAAQGEALPVPRAARDRSLERRTRPAVPLWLFLLLFLLVPRLMPYALFGAALGGRRGHGGFGGFGGRGGGGFRGGGGGFGGGGASGSW